MNKKIYNKPTIETIRIQTAQLICDSPKKSPYRWAGDFGQIPSLDHSDYDSLA